MYSALSKIKSFSKVLHNTKMIKTCAMPFRCGVISNINMASSAASFLPHSNLHLGGCVTMIIHHQCQYKASVRLSWSHHAHMTQVSHAIYINNPNVSRAGCRLYTQLHSYPVSPHEPIGSVYAQWPYRCAGCVCLWADLMYVYCPTRGYLYYVYWCIIDGGRVCIDYVEGKTSGIN